MSSNTNQMIDIKIAEAKKSLDLLDSIIDELEQYLDITYDSSQMTYMTMTLAYQMLQIEISKITMLKREVRPYEIQSLQYAIDYADDLFEKYHYELEAAQ